MVRRHVSHWLHLQDSLPCSSGEIPSCPSSDFPKYSNGNMHSCWKSPFVLVTPFLRVGEWKWMDRFWIVLWKQTFSIFVPSSLSCIRICYILSSIWLKTKTLFHLLLEICSLTLHVSLPELSVSIEHAFYCPIKSCWKALAWKSHEYYPLHSQSIMSLFGSLLLQPRSISPTSKTLALLLGHSASSNS